LSRQASVGSVPLYASIRPRVGGASTGCYSTPPHRRHRSRSSAWFAPDVAETETERRADSASANRRVVAARLSRPWARARVWSGSFQSTLHRRGVGWRREAAALWAVASSRRSTDAGSDGGGKRLGRPTSREYHEPSPCQLLPRTQRNKNGCRTRRIPCRDAFILPTCARQSPNPASSRRFSSLIAEQNQVRLGQIKSNTPFSTLSPGCSESVLVPRLDVSSSSPIYFRVAATSR
jgi:hypothetical protein